MKPSLPNFFWLGVLVQISYILALFTFGFFCFKKIIFALGEKFDKKKLAKSAEDIIRLAEVEGLDAHVKSIKIRQKD